MNDINPYVSVIIPAYNAGQYIETAIQSVLQQTIPNFEILIVDDASIDDTAERLTIYSDSRIHILKNSINLGVSSSRNIAFNEARGEWLALLDADDWWEKTRLENLLAIGRFQNADFVSDNMNIIYNGGSSSKETLLSRRKLNISAPIKVSAVMFTNWDLGLVKPVIRRSFINFHRLRFDESMLAGEEDFPFQLTAIIRGADYWFVPTPYYNYRVRKGSLSSNRIHIFKKIAEVTDILINDKFIKKETGLLEALWKRKRYVEGVIAYNIILTSIREKSISAMYDNLSYLPKFLRFAFNRFIGKFKNQ